MGRTRVYILEVEVSLDDDTVGMRGDVLQFIRERLSRISGNMRRFSVIAHSFVFFRVQNHTCIVSCSLDSLEARYRYGLASARRCSARGGRFSHVFTTPEVRHGREKKKLT